MHFIATGKGNLLFEATNEYGEAVGQLNYSSFWFPRNAEITTADGNRYLIEPSGFWGMAMNVTKNGMPYAELKSTWRRSIVLSFINERSFIFKRKSLWDSSYIMTDEEELEIASIRSNFKWGSLSFNYDIEIQERTRNKETLLFLLFILIYCARYMRMRHAAVH